MLAKTILTKKCYQLILKKIYFKDFFSTQIEQLEQQLLQMTKNLDEESQRCREFESERNEAVEKIKLLRDIIRDLEVKCESKCKEVDHLVAKINKLECIIEEQERSVNDVRQSESFKDISDLNELYRHIENLEAELQQLRMNSELAGSDGVSLQIKKQVCSIDTKCMLIFFEKIIVLFQMLPFFP